MVRSAVPGVSVAVLLALAAGAPAVADLTGIPLPDRTTGSARTTPLQTHGHTVVVHRGDSLWSISSRLLGDAATDARVTRTWHRLHGVNRARIGPDPDRILPGTRLVVPRAVFPATSNNGEEAS
jgi:nucleoid-associated protein YgaU